MTRIVEILFPLMEYIRLIRSYISQREQYSQENKSRRIIPYLINFEKFTLFITFFTLSALLFLDYIYSDDDKLKLLCILFVILFAATILFIYTDIKRSIYSYFYSFYYILIFTILFYFQHIYIDRYDFEKDFIFLLSLIVLQAFRSGKYTAFPVIFFFLTVFISHHYKYLFDFNERGIFYLFLILWISFITLVFESILYYISLDYLELREKRDREKYELELSRIVYNNFFPDFRENDKLKFYVWRSEQNQAGGDFYDLIQLREKDMGMFFADISAHGVSSAMMAGALKMILQKRSYHEKIHPGKLMTKLDKIFHKDYKSHHASAVYIFFNFTEMKVSLVNAGHPAVLYAKKNSPFKELQTEGSILGYALSDPIAEEISLPISSGDRFIVYTDGLTDYKTKTNSINIIEDIEEIVNQFYKHDSNDLMADLPAYISSLPDFKDFRDDIVIGIIEVQ